MLKPATLKQYGLAPGDDDAMLASQGGVCPICERGPPEVRFCVDHEHIKGWKWMAPSHRRLYVRGMVCVFCNRNLLHWGLTVPRARNVLQYMARFAQRRPTVPPPLLKKRRRKRQRGGPTRTKPLK